MPKKPVEKNNAGKPSDAFIEELARILAIRFYDDESDADNKPRKKIKQWLKKLDIDPDQPLDTDVLANRYATDKRKGKV